MPLLDELAELLGDVTTAGDRAAEAAARAQRAEDIANAQAALQNVDTLIRPTAEQIADRFAESGAGAHGRRAGRVGPQLGLRAPGRRRGAGALADDVAAADAALPAAGR